MRRSAATLVVGLTTFAVVLTGVAMPGPAAAATKTFDDRRGDAPARHDLRRMTIRNTPDGVTLRAKVRDLRGGKRAQVTGLTLAGPSAQADFLVRSIRRGDGTVVTRITRYDGGPPEPVRCPKRSRWRLGADVVTLRFDQVCLGDEPGLLVASVHIGWGAGVAGDPGDYSRVVTVRYG